MDSSALTRLHLLSAAVLERGVIYKSRYLTIA